MSKYATDVIDSPDEPEDSASPHSKPGMAVFIIFTNFWFICQVQIVLQGFCSQVGVVCQLILLTKIVLFLVMHNSIQLCKFFY